MPSNSPAAGVTSLVAALPQARLDPVTTYFGMCDASAAAALGPDHFVVANDERNQLKVYLRGTPEPVEVIDLSGFLGTKAHKESDLEGAATVGERIYWISSHGRNSKGEAQERRYRFFATEPAGDGASLAPVGQPYSRMLDEMALAPQLKAYGIAQAASRMPEAEGGFNIEGLAATPWGSLLIGMRNPAPRGMALLVELVNPARVVEGDAAQFGAVIELDLGGRAIRSIELVGLAYMIIAGPARNAGDFALYRWSGQAQEKPVELSHVKLDGQRPEALFAIPGRRAVQLLSDDGGERCKELAEEEQSFRSVVVHL
jgi:hypothetical protein